MNRRRTQFLIFSGSILLAFLLQLTPLPQAIIVLKPYWLALVLVYWAIETPDRVGLGFAFLLGLVADVLTGQLLGEQSLRLLVMIFIVLRFRSRLRFFPIGQQTLAILALLLNDRIVVLMVRGFSGDPMPSMGFWIGPVIGMIAWPFIFLLLDDLRARMRAKET
ncbi:MAG: rod shape-determining protein MreD [Dokdonella sp.]|uniref:rod shape-determining protein MreD n=1 Tax=Dokdonella sp. TaxID=2291710 RepID=UPI002C0763A0|nr:rod shape-determining protein MreD [Dokdonella sp.]HOX71283.1 rod shape-determining protein MreD [Dokdonella sp.]HPG94740.1 rod shape-determining protein MreD [Dokdonella sp.]HPN78696.1 rod shape-determining protein MreD [Dokdonella sp.]